MRENVPDEAKRWGADLIVAGTRSRHGVDRLLPGTVAEQIVRFAGVPVLLVRADVRDALKAGLDADQSGAACASYSDNAT